MLRTLDWCFTLNNWTEDEKNLIRNSDWIKYGIIGEEVGEEGTPHLQGYIELKTKRTLGSMKRHFGERIHWEIRRGNQAQATDYCKKDGNFIEWGEPKRQGHRNDLDKIRVMASDNGMRMVSATGNLQQIKVAEKFLTYNEEPRDFKPNVIWIYGPSGAGKSRMARELCDSDDIYTKSDNNKWFEGYDGHEYVILDDFRDTWMPITDFLSLIDRYERRVEYKGGSRQMRARNMIITSIMHPETYYAHARNEPQVQILRRIDEIIHIHPPE